MKKKLLKSMLLIAGLFGSITANAYDFEVDGIYYDKTSETTVEVKGANSNSVDIPASITNGAQTYSVTSIGVCAFGWHYGLTSVTIPNSVTSIGTQAFNDCPKLKSVDIPNSVTSIGGLAFALCPGLTSVTIGNSVTSIGTNAFWGCKGLTRIKIPGSVTSIGTNAFWGCTSLEEFVVASENPNYSASDVLFNKDRTTLIAYPIAKSSTTYTIPNSVDSIGNSAFYDCTSLTSITFGNSVAKIGDLAFSGCSSLKEYIVTSGNPNYSALDGVLFNKNKTTLVAYPKAKNSTYTIPNSVTEICQAAFSGCTGLTSITIPNSVTEIGQAAFSGCTDLTSVEIPNSVTEICQAAFSDCTGLTSITIPNSVTEIGRAAFSGCTGLAIVEIPNSVTKIGEEAFHDCTNLEKLYNYSEEPQEINANVFDFVDYFTFRIYVPAGCADTYRAEEFWKNYKIEELKNNFEDGIYYNITSEADKTVEVTYRDEDYNSYSGDVVIPASVTHEGTTYFVTSIGENAFYKCGNLKSVTIPNSVTEIGGYAFHNSGLTSVAIGNSVTSIGEYAFEECYSLTSVTIPNSVTEIGQYAFNYCSGLTSVTIGNSVYSIGGWAFGYCENLTSITIPNSVYSIGPAAFWGCSLTSVTIPNSVASIGAQAFLGCTGIKEFIVASGNPSYSALDDVLFNKDKTTLIAYPAAKSSTTYTIPNSVTEIDWDAFYDCAGLTSVTIPNSVTEIGGGAFGGCTNLKEIFNNSEDPQEINAGVFCFIDNLSLCTLYVPAGCADAYRAADVWKEFNIEEIKSNIEIAGIYYNITSEADKTVAVTYRDKNYNSYSGDVVIPASVTIGGETYSVTEIGKDAFSYCDDLASVSIPNSITKIGEQTFSGCTSLACVIIPKSVKEISPTAFSGCTGLEEIYNYSEEPQQVANVFANVNIPNCKLYVPTGYAQTYRTAEIWKDFDIQEFTPTGVEAVTGNEVKIAVVGNTITINGAAETAKVTVYGINGELVYSGVAKSITVPAHGVYIVRVAGVTKKVTF